MFGKKAITDALASGDIGISYEYDLTMDVPARLPDVAIVSPNDPGALATRIFQRHFFGDRLGLTLGPIVVSENIRHLEGRVLFKKRTGHFDLTKSDGEIEIMPGESLAVHSVEYVRLGARTAAYILPRLTLATAGLVVVPTYIDPYWEGILQLYIINLSPRPHSLKLGERIAICRFYKVEGADDNPDIKSQFAQKSHHYGLNWRRILESDADVQPRRKHNVPATVYFERLQRRASQFIANWHNALGLAAGAALIAAVFAYARFESKAGQLDNIVTQVQGLRTDIDRDTAAQKDLDRDFPQSGTVDVRLAPDQEQWIQDITLERKADPRADVWVLPTASSAAIAATGKVACSPTDCKLRITVHRGPASPQMIDIQVKWLVLGR
jgi:deoxycytidine triphosphate deaminase